MVSELLILAMPEEIMIQQITRMKKKDERTSRKLREAKSLAYRFPNDSNYNDMHEQLAISKLRNQEDTMTGPAGEIPNLMIRSYIAMIQSGSIKTHYVNLDFH